MTSTTTTLDWRGIIIQVSFVENYCPAVVDHLEIESIEPARTPLPITETGYRSHFLSCGVVQEFGGPLEYVTKWLDHDAAKRGWAEIEATARQFSLF